MELHYRAGEEITTVRVDRAGGGYRVAVGDRPHEVVVVRAEAGAIHLLTDGRPVHAYAAEQGARRFVKVGGADPVAFLRAETRRPRGRAGAPRGGEEALTANMHGQVVAVLVREGDRVERGATLVVLEAMKMELRVLAPHAGRVKLLACKPGEIVERGRVLLELEAVGE